MEPVDIEFSNTKCRICLANGDIPIFGEEEESNIAEDIIFFGDIQLDIEDDYPKHICDSCFELLMGAIVFRNAAKYSDELLKNAVHDTNNDSIITSDASETSSDIPNLQTDDDAGTIQSESVASECVSIETNDINDETLFVIIENQNDTDNMSVSGLGTTHKCLGCSAEFESQEDYDKHTSTENHKLTKHSSKGNDDISNGLESKEASENNLQNNTDDSELLNMFECNTCELQFDTMEDFEEHCKSDMHQNSFQKTDDNVNKVQCLVCDKFVNKYYFKIHVKLHGTKEDKQQLLKYCPYCEKSVAYSYFTAHINRKHKDKLGELGNIIPTKAEPSKPSELICDQCGKVFRKKYNLKLHILTHGSELKYKCMFCPYRGLHPGLLKIHVRTHTKDYNYKCTICPAKFHTKSNLNKHLQRHTGSGSYQCGSCDKRFYSKTELKQHNEVSHIGIKNHVCKVCGKAFSCRNYLQGHEVKVHKRKRLTDAGRMPSYLANQLKRANFSDNFHNMTNTS